MKKICFVTVGNIYLTPYLEVYVKNFLHRYSIIYWDRENKNESIGNNVIYRFSYEVKINNKTDKILGYIKFRAFATKILQENDFDLVIMLQTWSAILLFDILEKRYSNRFVIDVRDYTHEFNPVIRRIERRLFPKALAVVISSNGYKAFLPRQEYYIAHNIRSLDNQLVASIIRRKKFRKKLNISYIGFVNYQEQHKKLINCLKNDPRFHLNFIGTRALELKDFCKRNNVTNVTLLDSFQSNKILDFYQETDLVNNLYGNHIPALDYALSNKLYFAAELHIPILVCPDTYMQTISCENGFGYTIDLNDNNIGDKIWNYYQSIDWREFSLSCEKFMSQVKEEQKILENFLATHLT